jgi:hypothetical protein
MTATKCAVFGCYGPLHARRLCRHHYLDWLGGHLDDDHDPRAGETRGPERFVCWCESPEPDVIGMCVVCGRRVVTMTHPAVRDRYRRLYPVLWDRAVELGLTDDRTSR